MTTYDLTIKWGKETLELKYDPATGVKGLKSELEECTQVPSDRMKIMSKSKGLWKGVLKEEEDLSRLDWKLASAKGNVQMLLMGSAAKLDGPKKPVVFLEDLPPEEIAKVQEPSGLINLGNTCYLNSVTQCLRVVEPFRRGLDGYAPSSSSSSGMSSNPASGALMTSLRDAYRQLDRQADPMQPTALVQATKMAFPQFAQRGPQGQPMQQDAEEFFSGLMTKAAAETRGPSYIEKVLGKVSERDLLGADNLIDAMFGMKMKETLTCDEAPDTEPATTSWDLHRKLVCNIQGGSDGNAQTNVSHISEGITLGLSGKIEKRSEVLGRDAVWTRSQRIARLSPIIVVQFGRFYWKATPESQDHAGVKCKVMKPVAFNTILDIYDFCTPEIQKTLKKARDKALAEEEDRFIQNLKGGDDGDKMDVDGDTKMEGGAVEDEDLQAALAMSMEAEDDPIGPGLPANFRGMYELFGVVTHKGRDADGGHYMAWVKADKTVGEVTKITDSDVDNEDWFVFDDDEVSPCKTEDVLKLKGGGDWHMSYLNFYRAKK